MKPLDNDIINNGTEQHPRKERIKVTDETSKGEFFRRPKNQIQEESIFKREKW